MRSISGCITLLVVALDEYTVKTHFVVNLDSVRRTVAVPEMIPELIEAIEDL